MSESVKEIQFEIDIEWVKLIKEAKTIGLTQEEIRLFLIKLKKNT